MAAKRGPAGGAEDAAMHKRKLGEEVQELRERRRLTGPEMARVLEVSPATYSRAERGQGTFRLRDLRDVLNHLNGISPIPQAKYDELIELQDAARKPGRFGKYFAHVPAAMKRYAELEWCAQAITELADNHVCSLFQSAGYVRALMRSSGSDPDVSHRYVSFRMARQEVVTRTGAPRITVFQHEGALRTVVGGRDVMGEQLEHLGKMAALPNVRFRVIRFRDGFPAPHLSRLEFGGGVSPVLVSASFGTVNSVENIHQAEHARHYLKLAEEHSAPAEVSPALIQQALDSL